MQGKSRRKREEEEQRVQANTLSTVKNAGWQECDGSKGAGNHIHRF